MLKSLPFWEIKYMPRRIELHDSVIQKVVLEKSSLRIVFDSLVTLNVTDDFGFEFDNIEFKEGEFVISNPRYDSIPKAGDISSGYLAVREARFDLLPIDAIISGKCLLFIEQDMNCSKIFGDTFEVRLQATRDN